MRELKRLVHCADRSLTDMANEVLRAGLAAICEPRGKARAFRASPVDMGEPRVDLTKVLALVAAIEDEEHLRK